MRERGKGGNYFCLKKHHVGRNVRKFVLIMCSIIRITFSYIDDIAAQP